MSAHVWTPVPGYNTRTAGRRGKIVAPPTVTEAFACRCGAWAYRRNVEEEPRESIGVEMRLGWQSPAAGCGPADAQLSALDVKS